MQVAGQRFLLADLPGDPVIAVAKVGRGRDNELYRFVRYPGEISCVAMMEPVRRPIIRFWPGAGAEALIGRTQVRQCGRSETGTRSR